MSKNLFQSAILKQNIGRPPVWMMRQAGRYHHHYQKLKEKYSFVELCKIPEISCETAMGPIEDFDFDAAILFSDILFPLEVMGMGLKYQEGPKLDWHIQNYSDIKKLDSGPALIEKLNFQAKAIELLRKRLSPQKGLIGFVGGPLTLFFYAVEGSHLNLNRSEECSAVKGLADGRYSGFCEKLLDLLAENMMIQANAGADVVAVLDTCAGEVSPQAYREVILPTLTSLILKFKEVCPNTPVLYYSKGTGPEYWSALKSQSIDALGFDWKQDMATMLKEWSGEFALQGNFDPHLMFLDEFEFEKELTSYFLKIKNLPSQLRKGWICGLGHGLLPKTPEKNVRKFVELQKEMFR